MTEANLVQIIGTLMVQATPFREFQQDAKGYAEKVTGETPSEEELRFLRDYFIINLLKEFREKLDIFYVKDSGGKTDKGR